MGVLGAPAPLPPPVSNGGGFNQFGGGGVSDMGGGGALPAPNVGINRKFQPLGGFSRPGGNLPGVAAGEPLNGGSFRQFGGPQAGGFVNPLSPYAGGPLGGGPSGNVPGGGSDVPAPAGGGNFGIRPDQMIGAINGAQTMKGVYGGPPGRFTIPNDPRTGRKPRGAADIMASLSASGWTPPGQPDFKFSFGQATAMKQKALSDMAEAYASGSMDPETRRQYEEFLVTQQQYAYDDANRGKIGALGARPVTPSEAYFNEWGSTGPFENPDWYGTQPDGYSEWLAREGNMKPGYWEDPYWKQWNEDSGSPGRLELGSGGLGSWSPEQGKAYRDYMRKTTGSSGDPVDEAGNPWPDTTPEEFAAWQAYKAACQAQGKTPSTAEFAAQQQGQA
jgi:hypothetical protein